MSWAHYQAYGREANGVEPISTGDQSIYKMLNVSQRYEHALDFGTYMYLYAFTANSKLCYSGLPLNIKLSALYTLMKQTKGGGRPLAQVVCNDTSG